MEVGDLVRARPILKTDWSTYSIGLLLKYRKWEKIATVLVEGKIYKLRAEDVTKAGKKDREFFNENRRQNKNEKFEKPK